MDSWSETSLRLYADLTAQGCPVVVAQRCIGKWLETGPEARALGVSEQDYLTLKNHVVSGNRVVAVQLLRKLRPGLNLKEAKDLIWCLQGKGEVE